MTLSMERLNEMSLERAQTPPDSFATKPSTPDNITVTASKRGFRVQWSQVEGVDGYRVAILDDQDLSEPIVTIESSGNTTLEYFYYAGNVAVTRYFAVQSYSEDESSDFTTITSATTTLDVPEFLASDFTTTSHTGDTAETDLKTFTMPASTMDINDSIRVTAWGTVNNNANSKIIRLKLGSTTLRALSAVSVTTWNLSSIIGNSNSASAQSFFFNGILSSGAVSSTVSTSSEDTSTELILKITGDLANGGDSVAVLGWQVERLTGTGESEPPGPPNQSIDPTEEMPGGNWKEL